MKAPTVLHERWHRQRLHLEPHRPTARHGIFHRLSALFHLQSWAWGLRGLGYVAPPLRRCGDRGVGDLSRLQVRQTASPPLPSTNLWNVSHPDPLNPKP